MDSQQKGQDNDLPNPKRNKPEEEIPLWLQGLGTNQEDETEPQITDDQTDDWIKEVNQNSIDQKDDKTGSQNEQNLEDSLPDWISELSREGFREESDSEEETTDKFSADHFDEDQNQSSDQEGFVEISDISLIEKSQPVTPSNKKKGEEEDLPEWLREMIAEHEDILTEDTEPIDFQEPEMASPNHENPSEENLSDKIPIETIDEQIETGSELQTRPERLPEIAPEDEVTSEHREIYGQKEPLSDVADEEIEEALIEEESKGPEEAQMHEGPQEEPEEMVFEEEKENESSWIEMADEQTFVEEAIEENPNEVEEFSIDESPEESLREVAMEEFMEVELTEVPVEIETPEELTEPIVEEDSEEYFEESNNDLLEEEEKINIWENEPVNFHQHNQELLRRSEEDTVPTRVNDDTGNSYEPQEQEEINKTFVPSILLSAKKHLDDGKIDNGLDIIDIYIEEKVYLDEIRNWLEELIKNDTIKNYRLFRSFGDLALQQDNPEEAFEAYSHSMDLLTEFDE